MRIFSLIMLFILLLLTAECSNTDSTLTGGGTDNPNSIVGTAICDGRPAPGKRVSIMRVIITSDGCSFLDSKNVLTNAKGKFKFNDVEQGKYIVYTNDTTGSGILFGIEKNEEAVILEDSLVIDKNVVIKGRVVNGEGINVLIPGSEKSATSDSSGFYVINDAPCGKYSLTFISDNTVNYLPVEINYSEDTVYIKDVRFAYSADMADALHKPFETTLANGYSIFAVEYPDTSVPDWYSGIDFDFVNYGKEVTFFEYDNESGDSSWSNPINWRPDGIPGDADTAEIIADECILSPSDSIIPEIILRDGSILCFRSDVKASSIIVDNSTIKMHGEDSAVLNADIHMINNEMVLISGPILETELFLQGNISGSGNIVKWGKGILTLEVDSAEFSGQWQVMENKLKLRGQYSAGWSSINLVPYAVLDIENQSALYGVDTVSLEYDPENDVYGYLLLDVSVTLNCLIVDNESKPNGFYTWEDNPEFFIECTDTLFVSGE